MISHTHTPSSTVVMAYQLNSCFGEQEHTPNIDGEGSVPVLFRCAVQASMMNPATCREERWGGGGGGGGGVTYKVIDLYNPPCTIEDNVDVLVLFHNLPNLVSVGDVQ